MTATRTMGRPPLRSVSATSRIQLGPSDGQIKRAEEGSRSAPPSALVATPTRASHARRPQDPARDHGHRVVLGEDDRVVAEAGVPDAGALVDLTPGDGVVGAHEVAPVADERVRR